MSGTSIGNATSLPAASLQATDIIPVERPGVTTPYKTRVSSLTKAVTGMINVVDYGAVGGGIIDDTDAIQAAIDAANALYGTNRNTINVLFPYVPGGYLVSSITLKSGVNLYSPSGVGTLGAYLTSTTPGWVIDTPATTILHAGVDGVGVVGGGTPATNGLGGIRFQDTDRCWIKNTFLYGFANQGILVSAGGACLFQDILIYQALMDRSRAAFAGAFEVYGTDHKLDFIEATSSQNIEGDVTDANLYLAGILMGATNCFVSDCIGEISDVGIYVSGNYNRFVNCRADLNYGHGWAIAATSNRNQYTGCLALNNGKGTTNTYDGFFVVGTKGQTSQFSNCLAHSITAPYHRYGFNDPTTSVNAGNRWIGCNSTGHATAAVSLGAIYPSVFEIPQGKRGNNFTDGDTTPSVAMCSVFDTVNTSPTTITNFDDGIDGQIIRIRCTGTPNNTTIDHNGITIFTKTAADIVCANGIFYSFMKRGTAWYEI